MSQENEVKLESEGDEYHECDYTSVATITPITSSVPVAPVTVGPVAVAPVTVAPVTVAPVAALAVIAKISR